MISSPPQDPEVPEHFTARSCTPQSPKPVHFPSPANVPILEKQMDPMFTEPALNIGTPASYQSYPQQTQTPSAHSATSYYAEQQAQPSFQNVGVHGHVGGAPAGYSQSAAYTGAIGAHSQDTSSINNFSSQNQATASSFSEPQTAPTQDHRPAYPPYDSNAYIAHQAPTQPSQANQFQALLDNLSPAADAGAVDRYTASSLTLQPAHAPGQNPLSSLPSAPNLPPRPPAQDKPSTHPNFNPNDDIRSYHPHSQKPANAHFRAPGQLQPLNVRGGNFPSEVQSATRSNPSPSTPGYGHGQRQSVDLRSESPGGDDEDIRWPPEINKLYEEFLDAERQYVTDGQWDQFPNGSRLFIGNLPTEKVTKRDIFHRFFRHGKLAQISIKQAYGFVQFLDTQSCYKALQAEQGSTVRGRKMHLEISKPQRNTKKIDNSERHSGSRRRSRSPDYARGGNGQQPRNVDRYNGGRNAISPRDRENRRFRDDYRPMRSPSPRAGRDHRGRDRSRDRYRRSRSRSPRRYRSPSPRREYDDDDDLPLPFRAPHQIPDIQVLVVNEGLPRDYIRWVEDSFRQQGLRADVLILSPRLSEPAVVRRQIVEGVQAIVKLNTGSLSKGKFSLQVFDRRGGSGNVQFNEYADLDPATAAALVIQAKQNASQSAAPTTAHNAYSQHYIAPQVAGNSYTNASAQENSYPPTSLASAPTFSSNDISSLDHNGLRQLLSSIPQNNPSQTPQLSPAATTPDLARLLSAVTTLPQAPAYDVGAPPSQSYANLLQNPSLAAILSQVSAQPIATPPAQTPKPNTSGQPDMSDIMAQLAKYQR